MNRALWAGLLLAGCATATGTISRETNDVRSAARRAQEHLSQAQRELEEIDASAAQVHASVAYVQDTESPVWGAMKFLSVAVAAVAAAAIVYRVKR